MEFNFLTKHFLNFIFAIDKKFFIVYYIIMKADALKEKLEKEKKRLLKRLEKLNVLEDFGSDVGDLDEEMDEAEELSVKLSEASVIRKRINEINYLINKINSGTYGLCDKCKKSINPQELEKEPELILCSVCRNKKNKK